MEVLAKDSDASCSGNDSKVPQENENTHLNLSLVNFSNLMVYLSVTLGYLTLIIHVFWNSNILQHHFLCHCAMIVYSS